MHNSFDLYFHLGLWCIFYYWHNFHHACASLHVAVWTQRSVILPVRCDWPWSCVGQRARSTQTFLYSCSPLQQHSSAGLGAASCSLSASSTMSKARRYFPLITKTHIGYIPESEVRISHPPKYHRWSYVSQTNSATWCVFVLRNQMLNHPFIVTFLWPRCVISFRGRWWIMWFLGMCQDVYETARLSLHSTKVEMLGNIN